MTAEELCVKASSIDSKASPGFSTDLVQVQTLFRNEKWPTHTDSKPTAPSSWWFMGWLGSRCARHQQEVGCKRSLVRFGVAQETRTFASCDGRYSLAISRNVGQGASLR